MPSIEYSIAFVTTSNMDEARKIANALVGEKLAACCNIIPAVESVYRWEGKVNTDAEVLMVIKTRKSLEKNVIGRVRELHSYSVPEIIFLPLRSGNPDYLKWLVESTDKGEK